MVHIGQIPDAPAEGPGGEILIQRRSRGPLAPGHAQRFVVVLQVGRQLPVLLQQESVKFRLQLHVVQVSLLCGGIDQGMAVGVQAVVGQNAEEIGGGPFRGGGAVAHQGCLEKGFSGHGVAVMALLVHGIFYQGIVVEQGVRPLSADVIELGQIFGCGPVGRRDGGQDLPAEAKMGIGRGHCITSFVFLFPL